MDQVPVAAASSTATARPVNIGAARAKVASRWNLNIPRGINDK
jgi:hypothetical protein